VDQAVSGVLAEHDEGSDVDMGSLKSQNRKKKEYLLQYTHLVKQQERLESRIEKIRSEYTNPKVKQFDGMPHGSNKPSDLSDYMVRAEEVLEQMEDIRLAKWNAIRDIEMRIEAVKDPLERSVLELRYLDGIQTLQDVAGVLNYSFNRIRHVHSEALKHFDLDL
jgi:hypothetical protein